MVKFIELLEYIGHLEGDTTCSCCGEIRPVVDVYKFDEKVVTLCFNCKSFIEELLE